MLRIALTILLFGQSAFALYEDNSEVIRLAKSGDYSLTLNHSDCEHPIYRDLLLSPENDTSQCIQSVSLPKAVVDEVEVMKAFELENESDYDQRVTSLLAFRWRELEQNGMSLSAFKKLALSLNIPKNMLNNMEINEFIGDDQSFGLFNDLFYGMEYRETSKTQGFLTQAFLGKKVISASFHDEVELYPGGGFNVTHFIFFSPAQGSLGSLGQVIYVKLSWWNS